MTTSALDRALRAATVALCLLGPELSFAEDVPADETGFTKFVAELFGKQIRDVRIDIKGPLTLSIGPLQANLDRIYSFCRKNPAHCRAEVDTYVVAAAQVHRDRGIGVTKDAVRVVVRTVQYLQQAQTSGLANLQTRPLAGGLVAVDAVDSPSAIRMLAETDRVKLGLTAKQVHELAISNLRKTLKPLMEVAKVVGPGQIGHLTGDFFQPSRLVLLDSWEPLAEAQGGVLIVAAPATDAVFYVSEDSAVATDALRALARSIKSRASNPLSDTLLRWTPQGWKIVE
jgi:uncharacterized protein YtpQ (UPF0354 family)